MRYGVQLGQACAVIISLATALLCGHTLLQQRADRLLDLRHIIGHVTVGQATVKTLFAAREAPVLFVVSGGQNRIVNYRMKSNMMIVDFAVDKAILISGVGWNQEKITIKRGG